MAKIVDLNKSYEVLDQSVIGLGNFDGFHKGHIDIINKTIKIAKEKGLKSSVLIFKQHTNEVFPHFPRYYINSLQDKIDLLESLGIDIIYIINFTYEFAQLTKEDFILNFIKKELKSNNIVCGPDYTFGKSSAGNTNDLLKYQEEKLINVYILEYVMYNHKKLSSTEIRKLLYSGRVSEAEKLLSRKYSIKGNVIHGFKIGSKELGYPTANIELNFRYIIPKEGVYLSYVVYQNDRYLALTSIGTNPTITDSRDIKIETYIIDFNKKIYGEEISIEFIEWVREQKKFDTKEELIEQMDKDKEYAIKYKNNLQI